MRYYWLAILLTCILLCPSLASGGSWITYMLRFSDNTVKYVRIDPWVNETLLINKSFNPIPIFLNTSVSEFEITELSLEVNGSIYELTVYHVIVSKGDYLYELYYEKQSELLVYGMVFDRLNGDEVVEVILLNNPYSISIKLSRSPSPILSKTEEMPRSTTRFSRGSSISSSSGESSLFNPYLFLLVTVLSAITIFIIRKIYSRVG